MWLKILLFHFLLLGYTRGQNDGKCQVDGITNWAVMNLAVNDNSTNEVLFNSKYTGKLADLNCKNEDHVGEYFNVAVNTTNFIVRSTERLIDVDRNTPKKTENVVTLLMECTMTCDAGTSTLFIQFVITDTNNNAPCFLEKEYLYKVATPIMPLTDFTVYGSRITVEDIDFSNQHVTFSIKPDDFDISTLTNEKNYTALLMAKKVLGLSGPLTYTITATDSGVPQLSTSQTITIQSDSATSLDSPSFQNPSYSFDYSIEGTSVKLTPRNGPITLTTRKPNSVHVKLTGEYRDKFSAEFNPTDSTIAIAATEVSSKSPIIVLTLTVETDAVTSAAIVVYLSSTEESIVKFGSHVYRANYTVDNTIKMEKAIEVTASSGQPAVSLSGEFKDHFGIQYDSPSKTYKLGVLKKLTGSDVKSLAYLTLTLTATLNDKTDESALIINLPEHQLQFTSTLYDAVYDSEKNHVTVNGSNPIKFTTEVEGIKVQISGPYSEYFAIDYDPTLQNCKVNVETPLPKEIISSVNEITLTIFVEDSYEFEAWAILRIAIPTIIIEAPKFSNAYYQAQYPKDGKGQIDFETAITFTNVADLGKVTINLTSYSENFEIVYTSSKWQLHIKKALDKTILDNNIQIVTTLEATEKGNALKGSSVLVLELPEAISGDKRPEFSEVLYTADYPKSGSGVVEFKNPLTFINVDDKVEISITLGKYSEYFQVKKSSGKWRIEIKKPLENSILKSNKELIITMEASGATFTKTGASVLVLQLPEDDEKIKAPEFSDVYYLADYPKSGDGLIDFKNDISFTNVEDVGKITITLADFQDNFDVVHQSSKWQLKIKKPLNDSTLGSGSQIVTSLVAKEDGKDLKGFSVLVLELPKNDQTEKGPEFSEAFYTAVYPKNGAGTIDFENPLNFKNVDADVPITITLSKYSTNFRVKKSSGKWRIEILEALDDFTLKTNKELVITMEASGASFNKSGVSVLIFKLPEDSGKTKAPEFSDYYYLADYPRSEKVLIDFKNAIHFTNIKDIGKVIIEVTGYQDNFDVVYESSKWQLKIKRALNDSILNTVSQIVTTLEATETGNDLKGYSVFVLELPKTKTEDGPEFSETFYTVVYPKSGKGMIDFDKPLSFKNVDDSVALTISLSSYFTNFHVKKSSGKWQIEIVKALDDTILKAKKELVITLEATGASFTRKGVSVLVIQLPEADDKNRAPEFADAYYFANYPKIGKGLINFEKDIQFNNVKDIEKVTIKLTGYSENFDVVYKSSKWQLYIKKALNDSTLKSLSQIVTTLEATEEKNNLTGSSVLVLQLPKTDITDQIPEFSEPFYTVTYPKQGAGVIEFPLKFKNVDDELVTNIVLSGDGHFSNVKNMNSFLAYAENFFLVESTGKWQIKIQKPLDEKVLKGNKELVITMEASVVGFSKKGVSVLVMQLPENDVDQNPPEFSDVYYKANYPSNGIGLINFDREVRFNKVTDVSDISIEVDVKNFAILYNLSLQQWQIQIRVPLDESALESGTPIIITLTAKRVNVPGSGTATLVLNLPARAPEVGPEFSKAYYVASYQYKSGNPTFTLIDRISITNKIDFSQISIVASEHSQYFEIKYDGTSWNVFVKSPLSEKVLMNRTELMVPLKATDNKNGLSSYSVIELILPSVNTEEAPKLSRTYYTAEYTLSDGKGVVTLDDPLSIINRENFDTITITADTYSRNFGISYNSETKTWNINVLVNLDDSTLSSEVDIVFGITASDSGNKDIGRAALVLRLPQKNNEEAPKFSRVAYQAEYSLKPMTLDTDIKITNKKNTENIIITVDSDLQRYFTISFNENTSVWDITIESSLPDSVTKDKQDLVLTLTATDTSNTTIGLGKSALVLTFPVKSTPQFSKAQYFANYTVTEGTASLTVEDIMITNRNSSNRIQLGVGDFAENLGFHYDPKKNIWRITLNQPFSEAQIGDNTQFILTLTAEDQDDGSMGKTTFIVYLPSKNSDESDLKFSQVHYEGDYEETKGTPNVNLYKSINISSKKDLTNLKLTLQSEDDSAKYFDLEKDSSGLYQVVVRKPLPTTILQNQKSLILTLVADLAGSKSYATLVINLPTVIVDGQIRFSKILYNGRYEVTDGKPSLTVEDIQVDTSAPSTEIDVSISTESVYATYFRVSYANKAVTLESEIDLPEDILKTVSVIPLTLVIAVEGKPDRSLAVVNIEISYNNTEDHSRITFPKPLYYGKYITQSDEVKLGEEITILTDQPDDNIEVMISNEFSSYFGAVYSGKTVTITMGSSIIPPATLNSLTNIPLVLVAKIKNTAHTATAVLNLGVESNSDDNTGSITFSNILYAGTYDVTGSSPVIKYDSISLITNATDDNIQVHITNGFSEYFAVTQTGKSVTISLTKVIPADTLKALTTIAITLDAGTVKPSKTSSAVLNLRIIKTEEDKTSSISIAKILHTGQYSVEGGAGILTLNDKIQVITDRAESDIETSIPDASGYGDYFALSYSSGTISVRVKKNLPDDVFNNNAFISLTITASIKNTNQRSSTVLNIRLDNGNDDTATISFESFIYNGKYLVEESKASLQYDPISVKTDRVDENVEVLIINGYASFFKVRYSGKLVTVDLTNAVPSATLQNLSNIPLELMVQIKGTHHSAYAVLNLKVVGKNDTHKEDEIAFAKVLYSGIYSKKDLEDEQPSLIVDAISVLTDALATEIEISASNDYGYDKYFGFSYGYNVVSVYLKGTVPTEVLKDNDFIPLTLTIKLKSSGKAASAVLNIKVKYGHDDNEKESSVDTTGYIVAIVILTLLLIGLLAGASAFYYFRIRNRKYVEMEDEFGKFRFGKQAKPAPKSVRSSTIEERRPTGFNFRPMSEDDLTKSEASTEPAENKERRKSVAFDDNVLKHEIDQVNDYDIDKALEDKNEVTAI